MAPHLVPGRKDRGHFSCGHIRSIPSYKTVKDSIEVKEIVVGDGEARIRYVLVRNPHEATRDKAKREEILKRIRIELAAIGDLGGKAHGKAACELVAHPVYGRYLKTDHKGRLRLNEAKMRISQQIVHLFRSKSSSDFGANRPPIPDQIDHPWSPGRNRRPG